ncbi:hypothetical protein V8G54_016648 [Vigna mungo]|uniref:Uncharacterized protein n=1 Tax=Vigna mungo TaxID=3915 RepID=A0AAQ3NND9_VIGMU
MNQAWVPQVVKSTLTENLRSSLKPHSLAELHTVTGQEFGENTAQGSQHGPSGVDDFKFTVFSKSLRVSRKPSSVPTIVTREFTSEVRWGLTGEWAQILDTVWAVPWASRGNRFRGCFPHGNPSTGNVRSGGGELDCLASQ